MVDGGVEWLWWMAASNGCGGWRRRMAVVDGGVEWLWWMAVAVRGR
ncbi:hypothetical protein ACERIT_04725 [Halopenitus sp. H-Gu1]